MTDKQKLLSIRDACHIAGISRTSLYNLINSGDITVYKIGRNSKIKAEQFYNWMDNLPTFAPPSHVKRSTDKGAQND